MLQRLRHLAINKEDIKLLESRILKPDAFVVDPKWHNAPLITSRNSVQSRHNKRKLLALAGNLGIQALMCPAKDTFQKGVSLNGYPRLRAIVEELSDSMTGNAMTDFMYLFFTIVLFLTLFYKLCSLS